MQYVDHFANIFVSITAWRSSFCKYLIMAIILNFVNNILELVASTSFGQFIIKKIDSVLWILEKPAKYCVHGDSKADNRDLPWLLFWTVLIYLQIFRVVFSMILIQFNKSPIEPIDVVKYLQKWRRSLRSIRFRGLRKIRESRVGNTKSDGNGGRLFLIFMFVV